MKLKKKNIAFYNLWAKKLEEKVKRCQYNKL